MSLNSPLYKLSDYFNRIIFSNIPNANNSILNSFEVVKKIQIIKVHYYIMFSIDVISLFTDVLIDLAIKSIKIKWNIREKTKIPLSEFLKAIEFTLISTYFVFNDNIYKKNIWFTNGVLLHCITHYFKFDDARHRKTDF